MLCTGFSSLYYSKEQYIPKETPVPGEEISASQQYNGFESTLTKITTRGKEKKRQIQKHFPD